MSLKERIDSDIKTAMLAGEKDKSMTLRGLKSAILNAEIESNKRDQGLSDEEVITVLQKESKKRQESADLYRQGGNEEKAGAELAENELIKAYLPEQMSDQEVSAVVEKAIAETGATNMQSMGQVIGRVKSELGSRADGAVIAKLVKERLS